jgi:hypothetical protein
MSPLPLLSHRLFVEAAGRQGKLPSKARPQEDPPAGVPSGAGTVAFEVLGVVSQIPAGARRALRTAAALGRRLRK